MGLLRPFGPALGRLGERSDPIGGAWYPERKVDHISGWTARIAIPGALLPCPLPPRLVVSASRSWSWSGARSTHAEVVNQATFNPYTPNGRLQHLLSHECGSAPPRAKRGLFHLVWFCVVKLILLQGHPPQRASVRCLDFAVAQVTQVSSSLGIEVAVG